MPDYVYLLENRLSTDQRNALRMLRDVAREAEMILFLTGDAVRDLTSGHAVRELEVAVQGNALTLKKAIEKIGGTIWGEDEGSRTLYLCFPGTVRVDLVSTHSIEYKKPGHPVYHFAGIQDDLRRRDFTVNAMAISLNEGSFGLLMDPLNGVADIELRTLRMISNYGFIEDPSLLIRATRYRTRLGWELDPRTQTRYENAKADETIQYLAPLARSRELEQIGHEDDGLKILQALEAEGWMKALCPAWTAAKADVERLHALHDLAVELLMQGVHADTSAAQMQLLTAKLSPKDLAGLKKTLLRPGFVEEWNTLDELAAGFAKVLLAKENQTPSTQFKLFTSYDPEAVLWLGFTSKDNAVRQRYNNFLKVWPEKRQQIPYALMQEMRIRPELPNYDEVVRAIFLQLIDGHLTTPEEMKAFLEPYSPPAPPPQVAVKRTRGKRGAAAKVKEVLDEDEESEDSDSEEDLDDMGGDDDDDVIPKISLRHDEDEEPEEHEHEHEEEPEEAEEDDEEQEPAPKKSKSAPAPKAPPAPAKVVAVKHPAPEPPAKAAAHAKPAASHPAPAKHAAPAHAKPAAPAKKAPAKPAAKTEVKKAALKPPTKPAHKAVPKAPAKPPVHAKGKPAAKPAPKVKPHAPAKKATKKH